MRRTIMRVARFQHKLFFILMAIAAFLASSRGPTTLNNTYPSDLLMGGCRSRYAAWEWRYFLPVPLPEGPLPLEGKREDVYFPAGGAYPSQYQGQTSGAPKLRAQAVGIPRLRRSQKDEFLGRDCLENGWREPTEAAH